MATLVLTVVGGIVGGPLGAQIGAAVGSYVDSQFLFAPTMRSEGPRLSDLSVQASSYGQAIPRIFGAENRVSGNLIWSTGLVETKTTTTTSAGGKGGGAKQKTTSYSYHVDCAIALGRGPIAAVRRIWADGKLFRDEAGVQKYANDVRFYTGTEDQFPDPTMQAALGADQCPAHRGLAYVVFDHLELANFGNRIPNFTFEVEAQSSATVATVIEELCGAAEVPFLDAARTDLLDLRGYALARSCTVREALEPLRTAYFFDVSEIEGELQFFPADAPPVAKVPRDRLGAHPFGTDRPPDYEAKRTADVELPRMVTVQHLDPARDYQVNTQRARRSTVQSRADVSIDLPFVLDASTSKATAEKLLSMAWTRRDGFTLQLPIEYLQVEPGHKIVAGQADGKERILRVRRRELRLPGSLMIECETDGAAVLGKTASAAAAPVPDQSIALPGPTTAFLLDLPLLRDEDDQSGVYVAGTGASRGWRGAVVQRSRDGGLNYEPFVELTDGAVIGFTAAALGTASPLYPDEANSVTVTLVDDRDTLASVSKLELLNGANAAVIGEEVIQFRDATLVGPATYALSGLLRGRKGTEDKIAGHAAGDRFVLLRSGGVVRPAIEATETGVPRSYKAAAVGTLLSDAPVISFTHTARWAKPYRPAHVRASRNGTGDLALTWIRRTRLDAPWLDLTDAPLGEAAEAYEVDVMNGATVKRTLAAATPAVTYSAADQTADFGTPPATVTVRIFQISARVGRGLPTEATL